MIHRLEERSHLAASTPVRPENELDTQTSLQAPPADRLYGGSWLVVSGSSCFFGNTTQLSVGNDVIRSNCSKYTTSRTV